MATDTTIIPTSESARVVVRRSGLNPTTAAWSPDRILSALGHPGYGRAFSRHVLDYLAAHPGSSVHHAIELVIRRDH